MAFGYVRVYCSTTPYKQLVFATGYFAVGALLVYFTHKAVFHNNYSWELLL